CEWCEGVTRRRFVQAVGAGVAAAALPRVLRADGASAAPPGAPENLVAKLYASLTPAQKKEICFPWDYSDDRGLLRLHVSNNWHITKPVIAGDFYTKDQQEMIEAMFFGLYHPDWHDRIRKQLKDDAGGYGKAQNIAIFGEPGTGKFEMVMTGRHLTIRCDGDSTEHFAFGGPIFYGHAAQGFNEKPDHPGNVFWPQALKANKLYEMLDGKQREVALLPFEPAEDEVHLQGKDGELPGLRVGDMTPDQKAHLGEVLKTLVEPYRETDRAEVEKCLAAQGGLDECRLSFYQTGDIGEDKVWDNWRLEGPAFVWYFRGAPHVHVWVNVADTPDVKITTAG
ncbi:MAG TPA: DUF3500 domain-containing protein, partial [Planctomycetaceae bacterium]